MSELNTIEFLAELVDVAEEEFTPEYTVIGIYFGEGDPEYGGQHWNFTESIGSDADDDGVCTVKEIQKVTVYGGISSFIMNRNKVVCEFNADTAPKTGVSTLVINYNLGSKEWKKLSSMALRVFAKEKNFKLSEENG